MIKNIFSCTAYIVREAYRLTFFDISTTLLVLGTVQLQKVFDHNPGEDSC